MSVSAEVDQRRRIRNGAIGIALVALAFYVGFIALTIYRSSH